MSKDDDELWEQTIEIDEATITDLIAAADDDADHDGWADEDPRPGTLDAKSWQKRVEPFMKQLNIRVPEATYRLFKARCELSGDSQVRVVRMLIAAYAFGDFEVTAKGWRLPRSIKRPSVSRADKLLDSGLVDRDTVSAVLMELEAMAGLAQLGGSTRTKSAYDLSVFRSDLYYEGLTPPSGSILSGYLRAIAKYAAATGDKRALTHRKKDKRLWRWWHGREDNGVQLLAEDVRMGLVTSWSAASMTATGFSPHHRGMSHPPEPKRLWGPPRIVRPDHHSTLEWFPDFVSWLTAGVVDVSERCEELLRERDVIIATQRSDEVFEASAEEIVAKARAAKAKRLRTERKTKADRDKAERERLMKRSPRELALDEDEIWSLDEIE